MANGWYGLGAQLVLNKGIDFDTDTFRVYLIDTGAYTPVFATDQFLSIVPGAALIGFGTLAAPTITLGVWDASDLTINAGSATSVESYLITQWTGAAGTSPLLLYFNVATGLPFTPAAGGNVQMIWNASGIMFLPAAT